MKQGKRRLQPWRLLWMTVLLVMALGATALAAEVGETKTENGFTATVIVVNNGIEDQKIGTITGYTGTDENVVIPEWVDDIGIERISDEAFRNCTTMKTLTINHYVRFGHRVLEGCTALTDIYANSDYWMPCTETVEDGTNAGCVFYGLSGVRVHNSPKVEAMWLKRLEHMTSEECDVEWYCTDENGIEHLGPVWDMDYACNAEISVPVTMGRGHYTLTGTQWLNSDGKYQGAFSFTPEETGLYQVYVKGGEIISMVSVDSAGDYESNQESSTVMLIEAGQTWGYTVISASNQIDMTLKKIDGAKDDNNYIFSQKERAALMDQPRSLSGYGNFAEAEETAGYFDLVGLAKRFNCELHAEIVSGKENGYLGKSEDKNQINFHVQKSGDTVIHMWVDFNGTVVSGDLSICTYEQDEEGNIILPDKDGESKILMDIEAKKSIKQRNNIGVLSKQADLKMDGTVTDKVIKSIQTQDDITTLEISKTQGDGAAETLSLSLSDASGQNLLPEKTAESNGTVTVSMPYEKQDDVVKVYYKSGDTLEEVESTYDEAQGRVVFETKHFSDFLVTSEPAVADDPAPAPGPEPGATTEASFLDVQDPGQYYYDAVLWAVKNNITNGVGGGMFAPDNTCKREQVVTFLWRAMGSPEPASTYCPFTDIAQGNYYYKAVLWAAENDITKGKATDKFAPKDTVTRAEFVTFLWRAQGKPGCSTSSPFWDVPGGSYYYDAVLWAAENDITKGKTAEKFAPKDPCTRGQVVTFLYRDMG